MESVQITRIGVDEFKEMLADVVQSTIKTNQELERWLTIDQACRMIGGHSKKTGGLSRDSMRKLIRNGEVESRETSLGIRIKESSIQQFICHE